MAEENIPSGEWDVSEWTEAWTIKVGSAYACAACGTMAMVTKGGIGVMEPRCCGRPMNRIEKSADIR